MRSASPLNQIELLTLLTLARLGDDAYGVPIRQEIAARTGRTVSIAAVYGALDRLERERLAEPWLSDPRPERGGRARKHYRLTADGARALRHEREVLTRLWDGLSLDAKARGQ